VALNDRNFNVTYNIVKIDNKGEVKYLIMAYFVENTRLLSLSKRYYEEKPVFGIIQVDSFDEVLESAGSDMRPLLIADVERTLKTWADGVGAALQKTRSDRYILFMDNLILEGLEKQKFAVLDEIREINYGNSLPITLSIGIGTWGNTLLKSLEYSESALDLAQGRGGDQAVIKRKDKSTFYGGKSKGIEKKTKVKARLIAYALRDLINDSTNVLIMGHRHPDLDSMGAALGVRSMCSHMGKESNIVLQESNPSIDVLVKSVSAFGDYKNIFVKKEEAMRNAHSGTLLIVVDTHRPNFTECKELLDICDRVVV
jgi:Predicted signaling protein consisting of a modified GGDEF domain and a DHH domain